MIEISWGAGPSFPRRVSTLLHDALGLRDRYVAGEIAGTGRGSPGASCAGAWTPC